MFYKEKTRIVIKGHKLRRDVAANLVLKRVLERVGFKVFLTNQQNHTKILLSWRPHIVIEETPSISSTKKRLPNSIFVLLHTEGALAENLLPVLEDVRKYDYIFCWGNDQYKKLKEYCPELSIKNKIIVTGNPRMDLIKSNGDHINYMGNKSIGIMSSGRILYRCDHPDVLQLLSIVKNEKTKNSPGTDGEIYYLFLQIIDKILNKTNYNISFRPHPNEQICAFKFLEKKYPKRFFVDNTLDLAKWVRKQRIVVSTASSSYLEAYLEKIPCVNLDKMTGLDMSKVAGDNQLNAYKTAILPNNLQSIIKIVKNPPIVSRNDDIENLLINNFNKNNSPISSVVKMVLRIEQEIKQKSFNVSFPYWVMLAVSFVLSVRGYLKNKHMKDYSYEKLFHKTPKYLINLGDTIYNDSFT